MSSGHNWIRHPPPSWPLQTVAAIKLIEETLPLEYYERWKTKTAFHTMWFEFLGRQREGYSESLLVCLGH
jgi:hypothetical protein